MRPDLRPAARAAAPLCLALAALASGGGAAEARPTLVVALGASSTAGRGVGPADTYPAQLEALLRREGRDVRVLDAGVNGDTSAGMLARLDTDVPAGTGLVILQAGTNDAGGYGHDANIAAIVARLRARSIRVVLLQTALMRDLRDGYSQPDGHHLTPEGYAVLARRLLPLVEREIGR